MAIICRVLISIIWHLQSVIIPACYSLNTQALLYMASFRLPRGWLRSFTRITYQSEIIGIHLFSALMQLE
ncbi:hypothetical protein DJ535_21565 [Citrobacter murliniae]|uniref:Secreted protein n=1 Tax=Citrobacter murliniae TaxID=67829 RepID=A0ABY2PNZ1_9ENTR|nr:hypothetical protein DJ535_21565 [Citrobacter murliniae]